MHCGNWLIFAFWPYLLCWAHVRLAQFTPHSSSPVGSIPLYPQHWQTRNATTNHLEMQHCPAEDFSHSYELLAANGNRILQLHLNRFQRTNAGELATMRDLCLDDNGLPVRRLCIAAGSWQELRNVTCRMGNERSQRLNQMQLQWLSKPVMFAQLRHLLSRAQGQLTPVDVYTVAQIFAKLSQQETFNAAVSSALLGICREIMSSDEQVLRLSAQVNATNALLSRFEELMDALPQQQVPSESCGKASIDMSESAGNDVEIVDYADSGVLAMMSSDLSVFYVNPACENISGIAIYSEAAMERTESASGFWYRFLHANESVEQLRLESDLETATYLPELLWLQLQSGGASYLILKVYAHDALFVDTSQQPSRRPHSKVLSISIPGFEAVNLPSPLPFLLRQSGDPLEMASGCGYWSYGSWLNDGVTTTDQKKKTNVLCYAQHLTQFSFLVGGSYAQLKPTGNQLEWEASLTSHERLLDIITLVGCGLSLFGLVAIFLTAALVRKWRSEASTKVLLHLCLALALQLLLFGLLSGDNWSQQLALAENWNRCLVLGAALQYSVLVIFSWMLIIAFLQFQRYVTVIGVARPQHYILISAVVAWTLPLLPTLSVMLLDPESYKPLKSTQTALCYPSGHGLAFGVILPIALITSANSLMMISIVYSIHQALNPRRQLITQQLRLSVLLFFLLGLTWIFGLCSYMHLSIIFSYLFCLTATLQGFVLFVYFVLLNTTNRTAWLRLVCCSTQMKMNLQRRSTQLQSLSTSSTNYSKRTQS